MSQKRELGKTNDFVTSSPASFSQFMTSGIPRYNKYMLHNLPHYVCDMLGPTFGHKKSNFLSLHHPTLAAKFKI